MSTKMEELKELKAKRKELADKQKAIKEELNETKEQRKEARAGIAESRRNAKEQKNELRKMTIDVLKTLKAGEEKDIRNLGTNIVKMANTLNDTLVQFADHVSASEGGSSDEDEDLED